MHIVLWKPSLEDWGDLMMAQCFLLRVFSACLEICMNSIACHRFSSMFNVWYPGMELHTYNLSIWKAETDWGSIGKTASKIKLGSPFWQHFTRDVCSAHHLPNVPSLISTASLLFSTMSCKFSTHQSFGLNCGPIELTGHLRLLFFAPHFVS